MTKNKELKIDKSTVFFFDFFGVISSEVAPIWISQFFDKDKAAAIKEEICNKADIGEIDEEETYIEFSKKTGVEPEEIRASWQNIVDINYEIVEYIKKLKENHKIYLLSNSVASFLRRILKKYQLEDLFDGIYISSEIGAIKPTEDFFKYVINDLKLDVKKTIMIDDNLYNVIGAKRSGIEGIVFRSNVELIDKIEKAVNA